MKINVAAVGLGCPFEVGFNEAENLLNQTAKTLNSLGVDCTNVGVVMHDLETVKRAADVLKGLDVDVLLICIATWSEDHHLLDLLSYVDKPVILRAYPAIDTGSLCCAHQIGAVFTDIGKVVGCTAVNTLVKILLECGYINFRIITENINACQAFTSKEIALTEARLIS